MDEEEKAKILVRLTEKGDLEIIDGKFRLKRLHAAGIEEVKVRVIDLNEGLPNG